MLQSRLLTRRVLIQPTQAVDDCNLPFATRGCESSAAQRKGAFYFSEINGMFHFPSGFNAWHYSIKFGVRSKIGKFRRVYGLVW